MPKLLSNEPLMSVPLMPDSFDFQGAREELMSPRISYALYLVATNPTAVLYSHQKIMAEKLNTIRDSRAVRDSFEWLCRNDLIEQDVASLVHSSKASIVRLKMQGEFVARKLGYEAQPNDWDAILAKRKISDLKYIGQVVQIAYQCRIRNIPVTVAPFIVSDNPPDLLVGEEKYWVYATGKQVLNRKALSRIFKSVAEAEAKMGIISQRKRSADVMLGNCKHLNIPVRFSNLEYLIRNTKTNPHSEKGVIWQQESLSI